MWHETLGLLVYLVCFVLFWSFSICGVVLFSYVVIVIVVCFGDWWVLVV